MTRAQWELVYFASQYEKVIKNLLTDDIPIGIRQAVQVLNLQVKQEIHSLRSKLQLTGQISPP